MRNGSHKTRIAVIREHVTNWRKAEGLSREAVAIMIVEAHNAAGGPAQTGITFDSGGDAYTAAKTHADRIFRWLDDETKDTNFLPANFEDSILLAMPALRRMACVDELLRPLDLASRGLHAEAATGLDVGVHLIEMLKEDGEAHQAVAGLMASADVPSLERAERELNESIETQTRIRSIIEGVLASAGAGLRRVASIRRDGA